MKILSWNVNGLRAVYKKNYWKPLLSLDADIFCLQETKACLEQLSDEVSGPEGYFSYFSSSVVKKGYSGVATYSKTEPLDIKYGFGEKRFDEEGRFLETHFKNFVLINVYFPNGGRGLERFQYKLDFYDAFLNHIEKLRKKGKSIIFCGDVNTAHEEIDLARPKGNEKHTGFLPEERAWIDEVISAGYIDTFRHFYPNKADAYSYWDTKTHARDRNVGWRLDYFFISPDLISKLKSAKILDNVYGSDHCPVTIELK